MSEMGNAEYRANMQKAWLIAGLVKDMPLEEMRSSQSYAGAMAPLLDPTAYIANRDKFHQDERITRALCELQKVVREMELEAAR